MTFWCFQFGAASKESCYHLCIFKHTSSIRLEDVWLEKLYSSSICSTYWLCVWKCISGSNFLCLQLQIENIRMSQSFMMKLPNQMVNFKSAIDWALKLLLTLEIQVKWVQNSFSYGKKKHGWCYICRQGDPGMNFRVKTKFYCQLCGIRGKWFKLQATPFPLKTKIVTKGTSHTECLM